MPGHFSEPREGLMQELLQIAVPLKFTHAGGLCQ